MKFSDMRVSGLIVGIVAVVVLVGFANATYISDSFISLGSRNITPTYDCVVSQDGTGDFNGSTETTIQSCIDSLATSGSNRGGNVFIKNGTYTISAPVNVSVNGMMLSGNGKNTILNSSSPIPVLNVSTGSIKVSDFRINVANTQGTGILFNATGGSIITTNFNNIWIDGNGVTGIRMDRAGGFEITTLQLDNVYVVGFNTSINNTVPNRVTANNLVLEDGTTGLYTLGGAWTLESPWFESLETGMILVGGSSATVINPKFNSVTVQKNLVRNLGNDPRLVMIGSDGVTSFDINANINMSRTVSGGGTIYYNITDVGSINATYNITTSGSSIVRNGSTCLTISNNGTGAIIGWSSSC